jgi:diaminopropionate ammonia-lyase
MRFRVNPFRRRVPGKTPPVESVRSFHQGLPGYRPTPLLTLPGLAARLGVGALQVKDESSRFGLGAFKGLGTSWAVHRLRAKGLEFDTVSSATDGNHGRALAWTARSVGVRAVIFMTAHSAPPRIEAIRAEGAEVVLVDGTYDDAVRECATRSAASGWQVVADVGYPGYLEIPGWIAEGYGTLLLEYEDQRRVEGLAEADLVLVQAGVGGLLSAVVGHFGQFARQPRLVAVEPVEADALLESALTPDATPAPSSGSQRSLMACLNCGAVSLTAWPAVREGTDLFLSIEDGYAERAMRLLAWPEAGDPRIVAGESGAAGLAGLLALKEHPGFAAPREAAGLSASSVVLLINTEGATDPASWQRIVGDAAP